MTLIDLSLNLNRFEAIGIGTGALTEDTVITED